MDGLPIWDDAVKARDVSRKTSPAYSRYDRRGTTRLKYRVLIGVMTALAGAMVIGTNFWQSSDQVTASLVDETAIPSVPTMDSIVRPDLAATSIEAPASAPEIRAATVDPVDVVAPASVTIIYDHNKPDQIQAARELALRLQARHVHVRQVVAAKTAGPSITYIFQQDRGTAMSLAVELGGIAGPVRQITASTTDAIPGTIQISLP